MKKKSKFAVFVLGLLCAAIAIAQEVPVRRDEPAPRSNVDDMARFIAGIKPSGGGKLAELTKTGAWQNYAASMDKNWRTFEVQRLQPIRSWAGSNLGSAHASTVFYPFSGPDYIYARTFFPSASHYILCGLEPVGNLPPLDRIDTVTPSLAWVQSSMATLLRAGYFVTKEMRVDLTKSQLQGTLPLLCVMLVRSGDHIVSITHDGSHAEIVSSANGRTRTLTYYSANLSDGGLGKGSGFLGYLNRVHPDTAYIKAASYLMHQSGFSEIRNTLLKQCSTIVQDDSGIPLRYFDQSRWHLRLFGAYAAPLNLFKQYYQPDMASLYASSGASRLPFGAGYHWNPMSANLIVATATR